MHVYIQSVWEAKYTCSCKVHIQLKYFLSLPNSSMGYQLQTAGKWAGSVNVPTVLWRSLGSMQMHFILFSWCITEIYHLPRTSPDISTNFTHPLGSLSPEESLRGVGTRPSHRAGMWWSPHPGPPPPTGWHSTITATKKNEETRKSEYIMKNKNTASETLLGSLTHVGAGSQYFLLWTTVKQFL